NLCLLSKLFIDHKGIYFDMDPFLFYVLTERSISSSLEADHLVGYELTKFENKVGSPEKPLSDLGLVGYRSYWQSVILDTILSNIGKSTTIGELSSLTGIKTEDIISTLKYMGFFKYWKADNYFSAHG
ncbi:hypothetical protein HK096_006493, partial [Nowakowskiella sp. JEL0078]